MKERVIELCGDDAEKVGAVMQYYADAYEKAGIEMSAEEIFEEIVCDAAGDMNIFAPIESIGGEVGEFLRNVKQATEDTRREDAETESADEAIPWKFSRNEKWTPHLKQSEWDLLNGVMDGTLAAEHFPIDEITNWFYKSQKGVEVFAIYSTDDDTVLFAVGGKKAMICAGCAEDVYEEYINGTFKGTKAFNTWVASMRAEFGTDISGDGEPAGRKTTDANDSVSDGIRQSPDGQSDNAKSAGDSGDGGGVKEKFSHVIKQRDAKYMSAVESGDMETAQKMVDEAAKAAGYVYRRNSRHQLDSTNNVPWTMFVEGDPEGLDNYGKYRYAATDNGAIDVTALHDVIQEMAIEYYGEELDDRSIDPPDIVDSAGMFDDQDFVQYMWDNYFSGIYDKTGQAPSVRTQDGLVFFGADESTDKIKSLDPVTYDDDGNVIPLSERFNPEKDDVRFSREVDVNKLFRRNFTGEVVADEELGLPKSEISKISHALKTGYGHIELDGNGGKVYTANAAYLFDVKADDGVVITKMIDHDRLNIHNNKIERAYDEGHDNRTGETPESGRNRQRGRIDDISSTGRDGQSGRTDVVDGRKSESDAGGDNRKVTGDSENETYSRVIQPLEAAWETEDELREKLGEVEAALKEARKATVKAEKSAQHWENQTKKTPEFIPRESDVKKLAQSVLGKNNAESADGFSGELGEVIRDYMNGRLSANEMKESLLDLARRAVAGARERRSPSVEDYEGLKAYFKGANGHDKTTIYVPHSVAAEFDGGIYAIRKMFPSWVSIRYSDKLDRKNSMKSPAGGYLTKEYIRVERANIDTIYKELREKYPDWFPEEHMAESDILEHIAKLLDDLARHPHGGRGLKWRVGCRARPCLRVV